MQDRVPVQATPAQKYASPDPDAGRVRVSRLPRSLPHADGFAGVVLVLFLVLATTYSVVTPIFEGFDEHWHYAFVEHIATKRALPRQPAEQYPHLARQEASQPPLYYMLGAALTWAIPGKDLAGTLRENPRFMSVPWGYRDNQNLMVHTAAERFPWHGTVLAVHLCRLLSVFFGAGTVLCTYALAQCLFPRRSHLALGAMAVNAFIPSFLFSSALVSNDSLVTFLASAVLFQLARLWRGRIRRTSALELGLLLGCAALAKLSGLLLWAFAAVVLVILAYRQRDRRLLWQVALPAFALAAALSGGWYARNWLLYRDFTGLSMLVGIMGRRASGFGLRDVLAELEGARRSFWAVFGWFNVLAPVWLYTVYDLISVAAVCGLILDFLRALRRRDWRHVVSVSSLIAWLALVSVAWVRYTLLLPASQGRLLYPAISAISILLVVGWQAFFPAGSARQRWLTAGIVTALFAVTVYVPFGLLAPTYAPPRLLAPGEEHGHGSPQLPIRFGDAIQLTGYSLEHSVIEPGDVLFLNLCWQCDRTIPQDYLVFVHLLLANDLLAGQIDTYHGLGTFPTSLWSPGTAFCERYPIRVSDTIPSPGPSSVAIGLYPAGAARLDAYDRDGQPIGNHARLTGPFINFAPSGGTLTYDFGHVAGLANYSLSDTSVSPGQSLRLDLHWRAIGRAATDIAVTVQVLGGGNKIGQIDFALPSSSWQPGDLLSNIHSVPISPEATPGVYSIMLGVYDPATVQNLALYRGREALLGSGLLQLWTLRVTPAVVE